MFHTCEYIEFQFLKFELKYIFCVVFIKVKGNKVFFLSFAFIGIHIEHNDLFGLVDFLFMLILSYFIIKGKLLKVQ